MVLFNESYYFWKKDDDAKKKHYEDLVNKCYHPGRRHFDIETKTYKEGVYDIMHITSSSEFDLYHMMNTVDRKIVTKPPEKSDTFIGSFLKGLFVDPSDQKYNSAIHKIQKAITGRLGSTHLMLIRESFDKELADEDLQNIIKLTPEIVKCMRIEKQDAYLIGAEYKDAEKQRPHLFILDTKGITDCDYYLPRFDIDKGFFERYVKKVGDELVFNTGAYQYMNDCYKKWRDTDMLGPIFV